MMSDHAIIEGTFGRAEIQDCFAAMQQVPDHHFALGFVDPKFNIAYGQKPISKGNQKFEFLDNKTCYDDWMPDLCYLALLRGLHAELVRTCEVVIVHCGHIHEYTWACDVARPVGRLTRRLLNTKSGSTVAYATFDEPLLVYGKLRKRFSKDIFDSLVAWGFVPHETFTHTCPMSADFLIELLEDYAPASVYDPMAGSGVIAEACEALGITWHATEISPAYILDIRRRVQIGQATYKKRHARPLDQYLASARVGK